MRNKMTRVALRISLFYGFIAAFWIFFFDWFLLAIIHDPVIIGYLEMCKDLAFVAVTALLLYLMLRSQLGRLHTESIGRRQAERDLWDEKQFRAIFEMASIGMAQADPQTGKWVRVNKKMCAITGYSADEMLQMRIPDITHPEDRQADWDSFQDVVKGVSPSYHMEKRYIRKDGVVAWVNVNVTVLRNNGQPTRTVAVIEDISERKRVEEAIRENKAKLEAALDSMTDALFILDPEGHLIEFNEGFATFHKFRSKKECAYTLPEYPVFLDVFMISGELVPLEQWPVSRAIRGEAFKNAEYTLRRKDTGETWVGSYSCAPIRDSNGVSVGSVCICRDITESKRVEAALRESEERHRKLFEQATEGIVLADAESGEILDCNQAFLRLSGYERSDLIGKPQTILHLQDDKDSPVSRTFALHRGEKAGAVLAEDLLTQSGTIKQVEIKANVVDISGRKVIQAFFRDVSAELLHQRETELTLELLRLLNQQNDIHDLARNLTSFIQEWTGCQAVGIRLRDGENFPFCEMRGFPAEFVEMEHHLCMHDKEGELIPQSHNPAMDCMCGNVLSGRFNPNLPFFTIKGSFWSNCTAELIEGERQAHMCNRCNSEGYESVALIAFRHSNQIFGLLHLNDRAKGRFTPELMTFLEKTADQIAIALAQRQAQAALRESEERYRILFENATEAIAVAQDGMIMFVNPVAEVMSGYSREELASRPFVEFLHPDDRAAVLENHQRRMKGELVTGREGARMVRKDGVIRWLRIKATRIIWRDSPATLNFYMDITDQIRQEREINLMNRLYAVLSHVSQAVVRATDPTIFVEQACRVVVEGGKFLVGWIGHLNYLTRRVTPVTMWGAASEYVHGISVYDDDRPEGHGPVGTCIRERRAVVHNDFLRDPHTLPWQKQAAIYSIRAAAAFPIESAGKPWGALVIYSDEAGFFGDEDVKLLQEVAEAIGFALDNMEGDRLRRQAEAALRESDLFNREVIAGAREGVIVIDRNFRYKVWNPYMEELTGVPCSQVLGKDCFTLFPHLTENKVDKLFVHALAGETVQSADMAFRVPQTGKSGWLSAVYSPHYGPNGEICGIIGITHDITERKHAEEESKKIEAQLFQSQKMESVGRLAGGVAHDFNNMLGVIIGCSEMALDQVNPESLLYHDLHEIYEVGLRSADLTRQLLAFARQQTVSPKVLDLNDTISGMLKMLRRLIGEDINLTWTPGHALWKIKIDPSQIDQILANIAVNARDAIVGVGKINIETSNETLDAAYCTQHPGCVSGDYVMFSIKDTGVGMNEGVLKNIFEPFFTTKEVGKGTGLGLATVYGIVKQNSGFIDVESEPGKGTAFKIYLPSYADENDHLQEGVAKNPTKGGTETILLVEDAEPLLDLSKQFLVNLGYSVLPASSSRQAIQLAEQHKGNVHLLITDVVMPEMNGRKLNEKICAIRPGIKCLYMSGYTADVIATHGVLDEGVHFIQKPFKLDIFAQIIRDILENKMD